MKSKLATFQNWVPLKKIYDDGIIQLKDGTYLKIIKVFPINYNLKSELEKKSILESYKSFLNSCDYDIQILIQSTKENITQHILNYEKESTKEENKEIQWIYKAYTNFIQDKSSNREFSSKNFIIVIKELPLNESNNVLNNNLNDKYLKIREYLSRCGNLVTELDKKDVIELLYSCFNYNVHN